MSQRKTHLIHMHNTAVKDGVKQGIKLNNYFPHW